MSLPQLRNMVLCAEAGAMILPAMPAFYQLPKTLDDLADFMAGKILSALGFEHDLYPAWTGRSAGRRVSVALRPQTAVTGTASAHGRDLVTSSRPRIAGCSTRSPRRYDFLNHLLSAGIDRGWRRRAIASLGLTGRDRVLDLCTGTADLAIAACTAQPGGGRASSASISPADAGVGSREAAAPRAAACACASSAATRRASRSVDGVGRRRDRRVRDPERRGHGRRALRRSIACWLTAGGSRFSSSPPPRCPGCGRHIACTSSHVLPRIGALLSKHRDAYGYLPASVEAFATPADLVRLLQGAGFDRVQARPLTGGIVVLYTGRKSVPAAHGSTGGPVQSWAPAPRP